MSHKQDGETKLEDLTWESIELGAESEYDAIAYVTSNMACTLEEIEYVRDMYREWCESMAFKHGEYPNNEEDKD